MSPELQAYLAQILKKVEFKAGKFALKEGKINNYIFFLESGLVRIFHHYKNVEVTSWFLKQGEIFISVSSFLLQVPSYENIVALEDCICWGITYEQLEEVCRLFPEFDFHQIRILRRYYARSEERKFKMERQKPLEKYAELAKGDPELLSRVPVKLLASYLGISDRSLSRVRNQYLNKRK
jgi:CRP-like cAMP-binding protein